MPKCAMCDKGSQKSAFRSHSKVKVIKRQKPNLQKLEGALVCTRCRRTLSQKMKAVTVA